MTSAAFSEAGSRRVSVVERRRLLVTAGVDLVSLSLALAATFGLLVATRSQALTALQLNLAPVVVVLLWLGAVHVLGGYRRAASGRHELLVVLVASEVTAATTWVTWHLSDVVVPVTAWAFLTVSGTVLLAAGRVWSTGLLRRVGRG